MDDNGIGGREGVLVKRTNSCKEERAGELRSDKGDEDGLKWRWVMMLVEVKRNRGVVKRTGIRSEDEEEGRKIYRNVRKGGQGK